MKVSLSFLIATIGFLGNGFAHLETREYVGVLAEGGSCTVKVEAVNFEGNPHPLNERVTVVAFGETFSLRHPHKVAYEDGTVSFDHDYLESVTSTAVGATAAFLAVSHAAGAEGPQSFSVTQHNWKSATVAKQVCANLK